MYDRHGVREWDIRAGTMEVATPKLHSGSYFPDWLLERRRRASRPVSSCRAGFEVRTYRWCRRAAVPPLSGRGGEGADCLVRAMEFGYSDQENPPDPLAPVCTLHTTITEIGSTTPPNQLGVESSVRGLRRCDSSSSERHRPLCRS